MSNKTFFDTYNIFNITKSNDTAIDMGLFSESLILNENIVVNIDNPTSSLQKLITKCGEENIKMLIERNILSFNYDFLPFRLRELNKEKNKICRLALEDYEEKIDIEKDITEALEATVKNKKEITIFKNKILENCKLTNFNNIKIDEMNKFICENINNNKVIYSILKANKPYHIELPYYEKLEYEIEYNNGCFYINLSDSEKENIDYNKSVFGGTFLPSIMRTYISMISAEINDCENLWGTKSTEALFEANLNTTFKNNHIINNYRTLVDIEGCPNIADLVNNNIIDFKKVLKIRRRAEKLRNLLYTTKYDENSMETIKEYFRQIREEDKMLECMPVKIIRFLLGYANPALAAMDMFALESAKDKVFKTVKVSEILK